MSCIAINKKWIYKVKRGPQREILQYKARYIVRGFQEKEDIDYIDIFASVVKLMSYKTIFALIMAKNWKVY